jgi:ribonuclease E
MNAKREHIAQIEARYGMSIRIEVDPHMISPDYSVEKFKTATRKVVQNATPFVSADASHFAPEDDIDDEIVDEVEEVEDEPVVSEPEEKPARETAADSEGDGQKPKKRRRRRKRRKNGSDGASENGEDGQADADGNGTIDAPVADVPAAAADADETALPLPFGEIPAAANDDLLPPREVAVVPEAAPVAVPESMPVDPDPVVAESDAVSADPVTDLAIAADAALSDATVVADEAPAQSADGDEEPTDATTPVHDTQAQAVAETPVTEDRVPEPAEAEPVAEAEPQSKRRGWWSAGA